MEEEATATSSSSVSAAKVHQSEEPMTTSAMAAAAVKTSKGNHDDCLVGFIAVRRRAEQQNLATVATTARSSRSGLTFTTSTKAARNNSTNDRWRMVVVFVLSWSYYLRNEFNPMPKTNTNTTTTMARALDYAIATLASSAITPQKEEEEEATSSSLSAMSPATTTTTAKATAAKGGDAGVIIAAVVPPHHHQPPPPTKLPLPEPVHLLRIPKAGSSSFSAFLRFQYGCTSKRFPPGYCNKGNAHACPAIRGCAGHGKPPDDLRSNDDDGATLVTVFREPVARYVSAYSYPGHHGRGTAGNISLHAVLFPEYDNTVVNYLSGNAIGTWNIPRGNNGRTRPPNATALPTEADYRSRLRRALEVTNRLSFCGLLEYWTDTLKLFCRMYACPALNSSLAAKRERDNRIRRRSAAGGTPQEGGEKEDDPYYDDPDTMRVLQNSNRYDSVLYRAARERFCSDLQRYQGDVNFTATLSERVLAFCQRVVSSSRLSKRHHENSKIVLESEEETL